MIKFEKVSFHQYKEACRAMGVEESEVDLLAEWENIKLPKRATMSSAGYDFFAPYDFAVEMNASTLIPTGIRFVTDEKVVLVCVPRSGQGFKYGSRLSNTCGIVDADYHLSENEGHIMCKMFAEVKPFTVYKGNAYMQGLILPYYTTDDDSTTEIRNGGFGSTDKK